MDDALKSLLTFFGLTGIGSIGLMYLLNFLAYYGAEVD